MRHRLILSAAVAGLLMGAADARAHEYPTAALADYVFACMASNGQTQEALEKCSCSIDVIASIVPYEAYEAGETVLRMQQVRGGGEKMTLFRDTATAKDAVQGHYRKGGKLHNCSIRNEGSGGYQIVFENAPADFDSSFEIEVTPISARLPKSAGNI